MLLLKMKQVDLIAQKPIAKLQKVFSSWCTTATKTLTKRLIQMKVPKIQLYDRWAEAVVVARNSYRFKIRSYNDLCYENLLAICA